MAIDLNGFAKDGGALALSFDSKALPGLLNKELTVPAGMIALIEEGRDTRCVPAGQSAQGSFSAVLVKVAPIKLDFELQRLPSSDSFLFDIALQLEVQPRAVELDLLQLRGRFLAKSARAGQTEVHAYFKPALEEALRFFCGEREAEELLRGDQRPAVYQHLRQELQKALLETGMDLLDVRHPRFSSSQYEARLEKNLEARGREEELLKEKQLEMLRKDLDKEVLLKDLEARDEVDRRRKDARLKRYEELRQRMGEDDLKALVMMLDNDKQRAALIRELIDKDVSPEQRGKIKLGEIEQRLEERLREYQQQMAALTGAVLEARSKDPVTKRILCVIGKRVLAFDPTTNLHPEVPKEVYDTEDGGLGYLRSVRHQSIDGRDVLFAGAQRGIYRLCEGERQAYRFPVEPTGKGGANSVASFSGRIFASHSEIGIICWEGDPERPGELVYQEATSGKSASRGIITGLDGRVYFSAGSQIHAFDLVGDRHSVYKGSRESITAFHLDRDSLLAGTKGGQILRWSLDDPGSPREFPVKKKNSIYMLKTSRIAGQDFVIIGSKDYTVTVANPDKELYREYQAREEVRWVDGAGDAIVGVSRSGYKIFVWDVQRQSEPRLTIRVSDKVQDLALIRAEKA